MAQPVVSLKHKTLKIAVFENVIPNTEHVARNAVVSKAYKDKQGQWQQQQITISQDQLLDLAQLLEHTFWEINNLNTEKKAPAKAEEEKIIEATLDEIPFNEDR